MQTQIKHHKLNPSQQTHHTLSCYDYWRHIFHAFCTEYGCACKKHGTFSLGTSSKRILVRNDMDPFM